MNNINPNNGLFLYYNGFLMRFYALCPGQEVVYSTTNSELMYKFCSENKHRFDHYDDESIKLFLDNPINCIDAINVDEIPEAE